MNKYPPRPRATREIILQFAAEVARTLGEPELAEDVANAFSEYGPDGFGMAKQLDRNCWTLVAEDVETLDNMQHKVNRAVLELEKAWVKENCIQPPLGIGTEIEGGLISGVCKSWPARYLVKEHGCTHEGRSLLIKFENAVVVQRGDT